MAGFSRIYCLGGQGGYQGADGLNPLTGQILVGEGNRQWLEPRYCDQPAEPLGKIRTIVPQGPDDPNMLLDACIAFFPNLFTSCPSLAKLRRQCAELHSLDFDYAKDIPVDWHRVREEAKPVFKTLVIYEAHLQPVNSALMFGDKG